MSASKKANLDVLELEKKHMRLKSKDKLSSWLENELGFETKITHIQHVKIGGLALSPQFSSEEADKNMNQFSDLSYMQFTGFSFGILQDNEENLVFAKDLYNSIAQHPNVVKMFTNLSDISGNLEFIESMGACAIYSEEPMSFEIAMSLSAQKQLLGGYDRYHNTFSSLTSDRLLLFFDGMVFMSVVDVDNPNYDSIHGQVCREFFEKAFSNSTVLKQKYNVSPTPIRRDFHIVYVEIKETPDSQNILFPLASYINEESEEIFLFFPDSDDRLSQLAAFFNVIKDDLHIFYIARAAQSNLFHEWTELAKIYSTLPPIVDALQKAKFPRYFSTRKHKRQLRKQVFKLLFKLTKVESFLISISKVEQKTSEIINATPIFSHLESDLIDRNDYDTETVIRLLHFLDAELHTLEGTNAEVTGALVGVTLGAILSILITLITSLLLIP